MKRVVQMIHVEEVIANHFKGNENWGSDLTRMLSDAIRVAGAFVSTCVEVDYDKEGEKGVVHYYDGFLTETLCLPFKTNGDGFIYNFDLPRNPVSCTVPVRDSKDICFPFHRLVEVIKAATDGRMSAYEKFYTEFSILVFDHETVVSQTVTELLDSVGRAALTGGFAGYDFDFEVNETCLILLVKENNAPIKHVLIKRVALEVVKEPA